MALFKREDRAEYIGGSDWHHVFNVAPWGCKRRLWYEKKLYDYDYAPTVTSAMQRGTDVEPIINEKFQQETGHNVISTEEYAGKVNSKLPSWLQGHPDGIIVNSKGKCLGIAEYKAPGAFTHQIMLSEGIHDGYLYQAHHYMMLYGAKWCQFGILPIDTWTLETPKVAFKEFIAEMMITEGNAFWKLLQGETPPEPPIATDKGHCAHCPFPTLCKGEDEALRIAKLRNIFKKSAGYVINRDKDLSELVELKVSLSKGKSEIGDEVDNINTLIENRMVELNLDKAITSAGKVMMMHTERVSLDQKKFQQEHPKMYKKYKTKASQSTSVRTYPLNAKDKEAVAERESGK